MNKRCLLATTMLLSACSLAPQFHPPQMDVPASYKEAPSGAEAKDIRAIWAPVSPLDQAERGSWWKIFGDSMLDGLEQQAHEANSSLKVAAARVEEARAIARANVPSFLPDIDVGANAVRAQPSSASLAAFGGQPGTQLKPYTLYQAQGVASYEADLFGRVRDNYHALEQDANAQAAAYRSTLLALQADVAQTYFALRTLDAERQLLRDAVAVREEANRIMQKRFDVGAVGQQDLSRTQSELYSVRGDLLTADRQRAQQEHALAVLLGKMPSNFMFAEAPLIGEPPHIPSGLPSTLMTRRPDIAAALASMAAANERIGVARSAFFPRIILTASGGYASTQLSDLFKWSSRTWALGQLADMAVTMPIFDNGRNQATLDAAHAAYEQAINNYRQQVLVAFKEVEDNLSEQRLLAEQSQAQDSAAAAAQRTTDLTEKRYHEGDVDYFEVVSAQRDSLGATRIATQTRGQRFMAAVTLIRALGGDLGPPDLPAAP